MTVEQVRSIRRAKPEYRTSSGELVPGVTTIIGLRAKPALTGWAFRVGKENPELGSIHNYVDDLARIGSCAHEVISAHLRDSVADLSDYTANEIEAAKVPVDKFLDWTLGKDIFLLSADRQMVSDAHRFGGTLDVFARINGRHAVLDFKTGKAIYREHLYQVAAYAELLKELGERVDEIRVLQIGRTGDEGFTERVLTDWSNHWHAFLALRALYDIEKCIELNERWPSRGKESVA